MNGGLAMFALGVTGLAAAAAVVAPASETPSDKPVMVAATAPPESPTNRDARPPRPAPQPGGMISHSISPPPAVYGKPMPLPPTVAIPRIPGPADMMVATGRRGEVRTIRSFPSNEACDEALAEVRRSISNAFCVSTTPPPPPPEYGFLVEVDTAANEIVGLETHPSMAECARVLASRPARPGIRRVCTPKLH